MKMELSKEELISHVKRQLTSMLGLCGYIEPYLDLTLERLQKCFAATANKYYRKNNEAYFTPYHSGQYAIFLYYLANTIHRQAGDASLATRIYYLNKIMHSVDWYYEIQLPEYWGIEHPLGSVLGRAKYGNGFYFYQGCTVGGNKGKYPTFGEKVVLYANATVIGDSKIGNNVVISIGAIVKDESIPDNCLVFGQSPNLIIKQKDKAYMDEMFTQFWTV